jgi:O-antigen/teichoic acid export membrane protein
MAEKSLKKNAIYSFIKAFMNLAFPVITFPYASRILLPEGIGKVNFANSVVSYFIIIAGLGIVTYATREAAKIRDDKTNLTKFSKEIFTINLIATAIAYILFFIAFIFIPKLNPYRTMLLICSTKILFTTLGMDWFYSALEEFKYITLRSVFFQAISLIFLFIFVRTKEDILWYTAFGIISSVGSNICNLFYCTKFIDLRLKIKLELKKHIKPILTFFGMTLATTIYTMLDTTMLGFLSTNTEVGYYSAATKISHMVLSLITAITTVLLPRMSLYINNNDMDSFKTLTNKTVSIITLLSIPIAVGLFLLAKPITLLFSGTDYIPAIIPMQVMTPIVFIISITSITGPRMLAAMNKEKLALISYIIGATANIICNLILIPIYGALGAALGTLVAETFVATIQVIFLHQYIFSKDNFISLIHSTFATILMGILIIFILKYVNNIVLQIIMASTSGIILYATTLLIFRNKYFIEYFKLFVNKIRK